MADGFADGVVAGMATQDKGYGYPYPMYYGGGNSGFGFGSDWLAIIVLFALFGNGGWGGGFGNGGGGQFPWILEGQRDTDNVVTAGFNQAATASQLSAIQNSLNTMEISNCNRAMDALQTAYQNQITDLQSNFAMQQAFSQCCCDNKLLISDLKSTVLAENCADRAAVDAGVQKILNQLASDKLDEKNEKILELQNALNMASLRESQTAQNAFIAQGFEREVDALYNRLNNCPVPTTPVYGRTPIFTCNNSCGCGGTTNI